MLSYQVRRSIDIEKSSGEIIEFLANFENWPHWSPWLIQEPDCPLTYHGTLGQQGSGYEWNGDLVGAGSMTLEKREASKLTMVLRFLRPFKSQAKVTFEIEDHGKRSSVTWGMDSAVPWFLFFLKGMFKNFIGMDYDRGLSMLKRHLESGSVPSSLRLVGKRPLPQQHYVGIYGQASIPDLGPIMQEHFRKIETQIEQGNLSASGPLFALYESMSLKTGIFEFYTCCPVSQPTYLTTPFKSGVLSEGTGYIVEHTGEYPFLGNAWAMAMGASRHNKVKVKRKPMGLEVYLDNPNNVAPNELKTEIVLFCK